ncbi:acyltransferase [Pseudoxanthomonas sp. NC8]|nr:acyltransferase [Pseudoxanthomonas sp. NC8]
MVHIGLISYSLYLWHWPLLVFARFWNGLQPIDHWRPLLLVLSIALTALSHRCIEVRFRRRAAGKRTKSVFVASGVASAATLLIATHGIAHQGHPQRVSAEVLAMDLERRPELPFRRCEGRHDGCRIGLDAADAHMPSILFWGDSHMLAWAPALDVALKEHGLAGTLQFAPGCPPVFGVVNEKIHACTGLNDALRKQIRSGRFRAVVMSAHWSTYAKGRTPHVRMESDGESVLSDALPRSVSTIRKSGVPVYLMGPLPVYPVDIPAMRTASAMRRKALPSPQTRAEHVRNHEEFFRAARRSPTTAPFDPSEWMCRADCAVVTHDGHSIYRDSHHLSLAGAMEYLPQIGHDR